jgi:putative component of membrane protein insertase Oxa1/YidC/SpoIIIJ protein YidD
MRKIAKRDGLHLGGTPRASHLRNVVLNSLTSVPSRGLLGLIWLYRHSLSPVLPVLCGPGCGCRFHPTCAVYASDAVRTYGAVRGSWLALQRLVK